MWARDNIYTDQNTTVFAVARSYLGSVALYTLPWGGGDPGSVHVCPALAMLNGDRTDGIFSWPYLVRSRYWYIVASVVCTECTVAKRCVLEQKLLFTAYRKSYKKSIGTKMKDLDLCLEVVQGHVNHCGVNSSKTTWSRDFKFSTRLGMGNTKQVHK